MGCPLNQPVPVACPPLSPADQRLMQSFLFVSHPPYHRAGSSSSSSIHMQNVAAASVLQPPPSTPHAPPPPQKQKTVDMDGILAGRGCIRSPEQNRSSARYVIMAEMSRRLGRLADWLLCADLVRESRWIAVLLTDQSATSATARLI